MRYLVVGRAKTGTTVISKTIQNSKGIERYWLEPKEVSFFEALSKSDDGGVVKIIYDHWSDRQQLLDAIVRNELNTNFDENIFIVRDPRADLVSRIHYIAFPYFQTKERPAGSKEKWLRIFREKESNPDMPLKHVVAYLHKNFGVLSPHALKRMSNTAKSYAEYINSIPISLKNIVKYEDFVSGKLDANPIFAGEKSVGRNLQRTNRSKGLDDWPSFITEQDTLWVRELMGEAADKMGYNFATLPPSAPITPAACSHYVARLINEGMSAAKLHANWANNSINR